MRAALALFLLTGCNAILGLGDVKSSASGNPDAPLAQPDAAVPACPPPGPNQVIGCAHITHVMPDGSTSGSNLDLSGLTFEAWIYDPVATTFSSVSGSGTKDGVFTIDNVPDGTSFYLEVADPSAFFTGYFYTDQHSLDLGYFELGRETTPVTQDTELTVHATNMTPWRANDLLWADAFSVATDDALGNAGNLQGTATSGATTYDQTWDWRQGFTEQGYVFLFGIGARTAALIDQPTDDLTVSHVQDSAIADAIGNDYDLQTIVDRMKKTSIGMTDGTPVTVSGAFSTVPPSAATMLISADLGAVHPALHDGGRYNSEAFVCQRSAAPGNDGFLFGPPLVILSGSTAPGQTSVALPPLQFPTPPVASWQQFMFCYSQHYRELGVPGAKNPLIAYEWVRTKVPATNTFTLGVQVGTPDHIKANGVSILDSTAVPWDGTKAVQLSWDSVANANRYYVLLYQVTVNAAGGRSATAIATFHTKTNSLAIPAQILTKGAMYYARFGAIDSPVDYAGGHLAELGFPYSDARVVSGVFSLGSTCGNGVKETGEACDTGGDSATCNSNCTVPVCGDYHVNAMANEQCDNGPYSTATCEANCKPPVCGDGITNAAAGEQCDDGNTASNDGCSSTCTLEGCGNGTLTPPFEACDDGNPRAGDGCSPLCQVELGWTCTAASPSVCTRM